MTLNIALESVKDALGEPIAIEAKVRLVDAVARELTHSFRVEADIANPDLKLPAGVFGTTRLIVYRKEAGLRVPLTALKLKKDKISLFVIAADKKVKEVENVTLGRFHDDWAEVLGDAIKPGQEVVVAGAQLLADGDMIAIQVDPTAAKDAKGAKDGRS
jgi:multidrug efflux pump subunit AcrA (membrane-fusion protein)